MKNRPPFRERIRRAAELAAIAWIAGQRRLWFLVGLAAGPWLALLVAFVLAGALRLAGR